MKFEINIKVNLFVKICQSKREEIAFNHDNDFFQKCPEYIYTAHNDNITNKKYRLFRLRKCNFIQKSKYDCCV